MDCDSDGSVNRESVYHGKSIPVWVCPRCPRYGGISTRVLHPYANPRTPPSTMLLPSCRPSPLPSDAVL